MKPELYWDFETFGNEPIKNGTYRYAASCEPMLCSWAMDDEAVDVWDIYGGEPAPKLLYELLEDPQVTIISHESFDRIVATAKLMELGLPEQLTIIERWWDTAAQARAHSLPGALEKLCHILGVPDGESKMPGGKDLVRLFCIKKKKKRVLPEDEPEKWELFKEYCGLDTVAMRQVRKRLPQWNYGRGTAPREAGRRRWHLDQRVNDRGIYVDLQLAEQAVAAVGRVSEQINTRGKELTEGKVEKMTQRDRLLAALCEEFGVTLPNMQADTIERRLQDDEFLPGAVKELLQLRLQASTASVGKYKALLRSVTEDQRLHGTLLFCGAARTGRRSHRNFQPGNLARVPKWLIKIYDEVAETIKAGAADLVLEDPMTTMGSMVRACIVAPPKKKLIPVDLSNIESRVMAWFANEEWKLKAFRDLDAGIGEDIYVLTYSGAFGVPVSTVKQDYKDGGTMRLIGKVMELALQYWGAIRAFKKMAKAHGVELSDERITQVVKLWRKANQRIMNFGGDLEEAFRNATLNPGRRFTVADGKVVLQRDGAWLRIRLPSGRCLCYANPQVDHEGNLSYMGVNSYTRRWERIKTYGGKIAENVVQGTAADFMMENEEIVEAAGYDIVLDVHDEIVTEVPDDDLYSIAELKMLATTARPWAPGFPLSASGYETYRYRKE